MQPQRAIFRPVVDELPRPGENSLVFKTLDGLARTETHIAGKNIHQFVLRVFLFDLEIVMPGLVPRVSGSSLGGERGVKTGPWNDRVWLRILHGRSTWVLVACFL